MVDSKMLDLTDTGLMADAMAYRVKYRKVNNAGKVVKPFLHIDSIGVHKKNRGGVYPGGLRCKSLCVTVLEAGFLKEEFNHACVVVEEYPVEEIIARGIAGGLVSAST